MTSNASRQLDGALHRFERSDEAIKPPTRGYFRRRYAKRISTTLREEDLNVHFFSDLSCQKHTAVTPPNLQAFCFDLAQPLHDGIWSVLCDAEER